MVPGLAFPVPNDYVVDPESTEPFVIFLTKLKREQEWFGVIGLIRFFYFLLHPK
jgi:hypothetical protein